MKSLSFLNVIILVESDFGTGNRYFKMLCTLIKLIILLIQAWTEIDRKSNADTAHSSFQYLELHA